MRTIILDPLTTSAAHSLSISIRYHPFFDVSVEIERQPMNQPPRATMPQSTQRAFATVIIVMMLITGLVVAQKYTGYQDDPDRFVFPHSDDERSNPSPSNRLGRVSQLSVNRCTLINLRSDSSARESPLRGLIARRVSVHELDARNTPTFSRW